MFLTCCHYSMLDFISSEIKADDITTLVVWDDSLYMECQVVVGNISREAGYIEIFTQHCKFSEQLDINMCISRRIADCTIRLQNIKYYFFKCKVHVMIGDSCCKKGGMSTKATSARPP